MKRIMVISFIVATFILVQTSYADVASDCTGLPTFKIHMGATATQELKAALVDSSEATTPYIICLEYPRGTPVDVSEGITFDLKFNHEVIIRNLNIQKGTPFTGNALITVSNSSGSNGHVTLENSVLSGNGKEIPCLELASPGTILNGGTVSDCSDGVSVKADNVHISNANIHENGLGVHVYPGFKMAVIEHSKIYGNDNGVADEGGVISDGIRVDDNAKNGITLMENEEDEANVVDTVINYAGKEAFLRLDTSNKAAMSGTVEFFMSNKEECGVAVNARYQACGLLVDNSENPIQKISISSEALEKGDKYYVMKYTIPESYRSKELVALYTPSSFGTTTFSRPFKNAEGGTVVFVTGVEIPTTGPNNAPPDDQNQTDLKTGDGADGGGTLDGGMGANSPRCSLIVGDTLRSVGWGVNLWWLLFATGLLEALRLVRVRSRKRE